MGKEMASSKFTERHLKAKAALLSVAIGASVLLGGCASCARDMKTLSSDWNGGLDRTVTLYNYNGQKMREWSGKFDLSNSSQEVYFDDQNGKRVIIHGGIVVVEEN